ncbi:M20/M25/M40 family metallo-hydrolase [Pyrococcus abyssi]|uniref:Aminopeptidase n=1 Tax=Pyrococcus abyssi (strain GE5 / Orsay) TaxID=272844 RepID=Q9UYH8_PYRAB|nr:M20/M25/M40 family metallo-hydrolase [Pyrococcus abyssi]CAB50434.1 Aminopeptidase from family M42 [Pyrococcus abyssi GE5]CCE70983.1 TPA: aminopeptidase [Pyrococcus abyssi GE5]
MRIIEELKEFTQIPGISGYEERIRERIIEEIKDFADYKVDAIGNLIVELGEGDERLLFMAHMDEIGLLITGITNDGKLRFRKVGGIDDRLLYGRHVSVVTEDKIIDGVIGAIPPHLSLGKGKDVIPWHELVIDIGAESKEEALELVKPLDFAVFKKHFSVLNGRYVSTRSLDDRFGVVALIEAIKDLVDHDLGGKVVFAFTVQEEIGLKGARFLANRYAPEYAFAIDSFACCNELTGDVKLGGGPVIRAVDNSAIYSRDLARKVLSIAEKNKIPIQIGVTGGGTDASVFQERCKALALSVPIKYLHSEVEMLQINDLENLIKLIEAIALEL